MTMIASILIALLLQTAVALQPLKISRSDMNNGYHSYQPPVKTSVLKQLLNSRSSSASVGGNGGSGTTSPSDVTPNTGINNVSGSGKNRPKTAQAAFSGTIPLPTPSFEQRMRDLVLGTPQRLQDQQNRSKSSATIRNQGRAANIRVIETLQEYKTIVGDEREKIVAVRFYSTYCKACQVVAPLFYRLSTMYPDVIFVDVPVTEKNALLHQGLGIPTLPYAHIYHPTMGLVEEQKLTRNHIQSFKSKLGSYIDGCCPISYDNEQETDCENDLVTR